MPELGPYAGTVLGAYAVALALLALLVAVSALRAAQVRRALARLEDETAGGRGDRSALQERHGQA